MRCTGWSVTAGRAQEGGDVGPTEAVDRLLRVADEEEPTGQRWEVAGHGRCRRIGGEERRDLDLDGVGVLELVEQEPAVALRSSAADPSPRRVAEHVAGQDEEVVEGEAPVPAAVLRLGHGEAGQLVAETAEDGLDHRVERRAPGRCPRACGRPGPSPRRGRPSRCRSRSSPSRRRRGRPSWVARCGAARRGRRPRRRPARPGRPPPRASPATSPAGRQPACRSPPARGWPRAAPARRPRAAGGRGPEAPDEVRRDAARGPSCRRAARPPSAAGRR